MPHLVQVKLEKRQLGVGGHALVTVGLPKTLDYPTHCITSMHTRRRQTDRVLKKK